MMEYFSIELTEMTGGQEDTIDSEAGTISVFTDQLLDKKKATIQIIYYQLFKSFI